VYTDTHKWRSLPPKEGEPQSKEWEGKTHNWCTKHKGWVIHDPKKCTSNIKERLKNDKASPKKTGSPKRKRLDQSDDQMNRILKSIMDKSDEEYCQEIDE